MYAILADIHANLAALNAVLEDIERRGGVDEVWCLGDIVGYGPEPHACIATLRQLQHVSVMGNHGQQIKSDIAFLNQMPLRIEREDFTLVHGSPREPLWEYLHSPLSAKQSLSYVNTRYCLVGHTHSPALFSFDDRSNCTVERLEPDNPVELGKERLIINPGAVGQPRDGDPRASYALLDNGAGTLTLHRISYNIPATQEGILSSNLPATLATRLNYGL